MCVKFTVLTLTFLFYTHHAQNMRLCVWYGSDGFTLKGAFNTGVDYCFLG